MALEHTNSPLNQIKCAQRTNLPLIGCIFFFKLYFTRLCRCRFSTDEGECWHTYNFTDDPLHFSGMDSEPGSRSMNVSLWGYRNYLSKWVVITIDFRRLFSRECRLISQGAVANRRP